MKLDVLEQGFAPLDGEAIRLRMFTASDITEDYVGWLNDPVVTRFSNQRFVRHTAQSCASYFESFAGTPNLFLLIEEKSTGRAVGTVTVYFSLPHETADVGIMVGHRQVWGKGYGQQAWNAVLAWLGGTVRVRKITAGTLACNLAMLRLMERSAMVPDGMRKGQELVDEIPQDICYFAKYN